jgi:response regulator RpfG family c-di-GMP phosphodiesterase
MVWAGIYVSPLPLSLMLGANLILFNTLHLRNEWKKVDQTAEQNAHTQAFMVQALASLAAIRDQETGGHLLRTQHYIRLLCEAVRDHPRFRLALDPETVELLVQVVPLHDIGKVGIPDNILQNPGPLTPEEFEIVKRHVDHGREVLETALARSGAPNQRMLWLAHELVSSHHERWDGSGYPKGLRGEEIPIPGRLMAVADVYDALVSKRVYKAPMSHAQAVEIIRSGRGAHFDPDLVDAFLKSQNQWSRVAREFADGNFRGATAGG